MQRECILALLTLCLAAPGAIGDSERRDTAVEPTSWGKVVGQVYDAQVGQPIAGATVSVRQSDEFAASGRTVGTTDTMGRYRCDAVIGRTSENFDIARALVSHPIAILLGSATNKTRRIDVTRVCLRVTREGYKPFEGIVRCRSRDPERFSIALQPVLLAKADSPDVSATADGWGTASVTAVSVDPSVLRPGARAVLSAQVQSPPVAGSREARVACDLTLNGRQVRRWLKLRSTAPDGMLVFTDAYTVPATATSQAGEITARLIGYPYDVVEGGEQARGLFLVTVSDDEDSAARTRSLAFRALQGGDNVQAALRLKELCALQAACVWDCEQLARVSEILHDTATAAAALKLAVDLTPEKPEQPRLVRIGRYAAALVANAESGKVLTDYGPVVQRVKEPERPKKIPDALMVALGNAYVQQGKLDEAEAISQALLKWPDSGLLEETGRFRNALRLAQAGARVKAEPASAEAHAIYGRALMDQCRWEEAVVELRTAATADASLPSIQHDLAYAILHLQNTQSLDGTDLDAAIRSAERATQVQDDKGRVQLTKDFFTWHRYALLLYAQARRQQDAGDRNAPTTIRGCRDALRAALRCGRSGARVSSGVYAGFIGYLGGSMVAVPGFAYPEAGSDFELLQGLLALEQHPDDYLTHLRIGSALVDLQQPALADAPIRRALALRPDCADARYAAACVAIQTGDRRAALEALSEVARANPRHPGANLLLAKLHTEDGDTAAAAACLSAHARAYGAARPAAPAPQSVRLP